jgi:hypothetical protein
LHRCTACVPFIAFLTFVPFYFLGLLNDADQQKFDRLRFVSVHFLFQGRFCQAPLVSFVQYASLRTVLVLFTLHRAHSVCCANFLCTVCVMRTICIARTVYVVRALASYVVRCAPAMCVRCASCARCAHGLRRAYVRLPCDVCTLCVVCTIYIVRTVFFVRCAPAMRCVYGVRRASCGANFLLCVVRSEVCVFATLRLEVSYNMIHLCRILSIVITSYSHHHHFTINTLGRAQARSRLDACRPRPPHRGQL